MGLFSKLKKSSRSLICINKKSRDSTPSTDEKAKSLTDSMTADNVRDNFTEKSASEEEPEVEENTPAVPTEERTDGEECTKAASQEQAKNATTGDATTNDKFATSEQTIDATISGEPGDEDATNEPRGSATQVSLLNCVSSKESDKDVDFADHGTLREANSENSAVTPTKVDLSPKEQPKSQQSFNEVTCAPAAKAAAKDSSESAAVSSYLCCGLGV